MKQRIIEVVVQADGSLKIEAVGFAGADCEKATAFLEDALGVRSERKRKTEYYCREEAKQRQKIGG